MSSTIKYRSEIDGLRAIAVIAVIIYHINPSWLVGGFLGVDVFFVISGYLITAIIQRNINAGRFSLSGFWVRRVKRLYPAMMAMVCTTAVVGNFVLIRPERIDLVKQSIGAIFSFSNILLWKTTNGYWSASSENIALLHTWSLSLEEQFYIFFPLLLVVLSKWIRNSALYVTLLLTLISFSLSVYLTDIDRSGAFYLLHTRFWELSIGSLLALIELKRPAWFTDKKHLSFLAPVGLALVAYSLLAVKNDADFPKWKPILACIGTALILAFSRHRGIGKTVLEWTPMRYVGKISYSLYLWHWPVIVFANYISPNASLLAILSVTLLFATGSYYLIETPFRHGFKGALPTIACMPAVAGLCLLPIYLDRVNPTLPEALIDFESPESLSRAWQFEATASLMQGEGGIKVGDTSRGIDIMLIGSSHARVLGPSFATFAMNSGKSLEVLATSGVEVTRKEASQFKKNAGEVNAARLAYLAEAKPQATVVVGMWSSEYKEPSFQENLQTTLESVSNASQKVVVLSQVPLMELPPKYHGAFRKYVLALSRADEPTRIASYQPVLEANQIVADTIAKIGSDKIQFVDVYPLLIDEQGFVQYLREGKLLYSDYHHVNNRGADYLFEAAIRPQLNR